MKRLIKLLSRRIRFRMIITDSRNPTRVASFTFKDILKGRVQTKSGYQVRIKFLK